MNNNPELKKRPLVITWFCLTTFLGAFLLFQLEPLVGKIVTPKYGGTASIWSVCLLFFQLVVLTGYGLTLAITKLSKRMQIICYVMLVAVSLFWNRVPAGEFWQLSITEEPVWNLLIALAKNAAVPCIVLATVSGVMQFWFGLAKLGNPYPLYSVSNIGSFTALLVYPILIEPRFTIPKTLSIWSAGYSALAALIAVCATVFWQTPKNDKLSDLTQDANNDANKPVTPKAFLWWTTLSLMGSLVLLSYTNYITSDITPMPMLWVLPLAIYLLTFALVFGNLAFYKRGFFLNTWMPICAIEPLCTQFSTALGLALNLFLIFELCMICHGELSKSKPPVKHLPAFYFAVSLGGALGGIFVGIVAPFVFNFDAERFFVLVILGLFTVYEVAVKKFQKVGKNNFAFIIIGIMLILTLIAWCKITPQEIVYRQRNFYSAVRVKKQNDCLALIHGNIIHGQQYLDPARKTQAAGFYYGPPLAVVADFVHSCHSPAPIAIGAVGLGVGTLAVYGRKSDTITFYELDPKIKIIADRMFTYLSQSKAKVSVFVGDGRALLQAKTPQFYDLILIDAFNGDAIPCHLLTREALLVYLKHLKPDGILLFHTTNRYVDLAPLLGNLAKDLKLAVCGIRFLNTITYVAMCRDGEQIQKLTQFAYDHKASYPTVETYKVPIDASKALWTDDFTSLFGVLKLH